MSLTLKIAIVDDEEDAVMLIKTLCEGQANTEVVYTNTSSTEAAKELLDIDFDLLLLDIRMPYISGFGLLDRIQSKKFHLIFVTAYDDHALKAFRYSAIDYLQKPIDIEEFDEAILKVKGLSESQGASQRLEILEDLLIQKKTPEKIVVPSGSGFSLIPLKEISFLKAEGSYTHVQLTENRKHLVSNSLGTFSYLLDLPQFERVHHSYIVNMNHIESYDKSDGGFIKLVEGHEVLVSVRKKASFLSNLKSFFQG